MSRLQLLQSGVWAAVIDLTLQLCGPSKQHSPGIVKKEERSHLMNDLQAWVALVSMKAIIDTF